MRCEEKSTKYKTNEIGSMCWVCACARMWVKTNAREGLREWDSLVTSDKNWCWGIDANSHDEFRFLRFTSHHFWSIGVTDERTMYWHRECGACVCVSVGWARKKFHKNIFHIHIVTWQQWIFYVCMPSGSQASDTFSHCSDLSWFSDEWNLYRLRYINTLYLYLLSMQKMLASHIALKSLGICYAFTMREWRTEEKKKTILI